MKTKENTTLVPVSITANMKNVRENIIRLTVNLLIAGIVLRKPVIAVIISNILVQVPEKALIPTAKPVTENMDHVSAENHMNGKTKNVIHQINAYKERKWDTIFIVTEHVQKN